MRLTTLGTGTASPSARVNAGHLLEAGANYADIADVAAHAIGDENIAERGVFPSGRENRQILFAGGNDPGVLGIDLDEQVAAFRERPLEGEYPYLWLDAKIERVRERGGVRQKALVIA